MARGQNLINKVFNRPLLITPEDLQPITDYLSNPERASTLRLDMENVSAPKLEDYSNENSYKKAVFDYLDINPDTMTGLLSVDGVLVNRQGIKNAECVELTSYQGLKKRFELQVEQGVKTVVLMVSSGGGEAYGAWSTANYVKKIAQENNVKLVAYVDGMAASAAFVWACVADVLVSNPMGSVGSIGVLVQLYNDSKMLDNLGITRQFVYAGDNKIPFDKEGEFAETFIADLQKSVDKTYLSFVGHVAKNRDLTEQAIIDTQASVYDADDALKLGLIDSIMELEEFELEYGLKSKSKANNTSPYLLKTTQEDDMSDTQMDNLAQLQVKLDAAQEVNKDLKDQLSTLSSQLEASQKEVDNFKEMAQTEADKREAMELQARKDARQSQLEAALGKDNDKVGKLLESTMGLNDEAFGVYTEALGYSQEKLQNSFDEQGDEGDESDIQLSLGAKIAQRLQQK